mgnify:CR=1 FL=1
MLYGVDLLYVALENYAGNYAETSIVDSIIFFCNLG